MERKGEEEKEGRESVGEGKGGEGKSRGGEGDGLSSSKKTFKKPWSGTLANYERSTAVVA